METTIENNKLIAEFMGNEIEETLEGLKVYAIDEQNPDFLPDLKTEFYEVHELKYSTSWDWLIPVIEKIETMATCSIEIKGAFCTIKSQNLNPKQAGYYGATSHGDNKLHSVYKAVIQFIQWYNQQTK